MIMTPTSLQMMIVIIAAVALLQSAVVDAFSIRDTPSDRRSILQQIASATVVASLPCSPANALLVDNSSPDLPAFGGGIAEAKQRL